MMGQDAINAGCTDHDAERYAQARQQGEEPWQAVFTIPIGLRIRLFCGPAIFTILILKFGLDKAHEIVMRTIIKACREEPDDTDLLMGYRPVTDMSLYEIPKTQSNTL